MTRKFTVKRNDSDEVESSPISAQEIIKKCKTNYTAVRLYQ